MESMGKPEHEFDHNQNVIIGKLASGMSFCGVFELVIGIIYGIVAALALVGGGVFAALIYAVSAAIWILLAGMQMRAAGMFRSIVDTQGSDITLLMVALEQMRSYFHTKRVLYIIAMCLLVVGILLVFLTMGRSHSEMRYGG